MAVEIRGTIKRASGGALVAEVPFGPTVWGLKGQEISVGGTTARVLDCGSRFKRNGYAYVYLYLAESAPPVAPARPERADALLDEYEQTVAENAEDAGEHDASLDRIEQDRARYARAAERQRARQAVAAQIKAAGTRPDGQNAPVGRLIAVQDNDWFVLGEDRVWYVLRNSRGGDDWTLNNVGGYAIGWYAERTDELTEAVLAL